MILLVGVTLLASALAIAVAPLARYTYGQARTMPASSRTTVYVGTAAVWLAALAGALAVAILVDPWWVPCAIAASGVVGMVALAVFTTSAKEEQRRIQAALAQVGANGAFHEQRLSVRLQAWLLTLRHDGIMARAIRVVVPVLAVVTALMWMFLEGVSW